jgi:hypothetical protein
MQQRTKRKTIYNKAARRRQLNLKTYWTIQSNRMLKYNIMKLPVLSPQANYTDRVDHRLLAKVVPTFADRGCHVVSVMDPYDRILGFLDRSRYFFFQVPTRLYSRGWVEPVPDPLLLRKCGSLGNRTWDLWICSRELWPLDHRADAALSKQTFRVVDGD